MPVVSGRILPAASRISVVITMALNAIGCSGEVDRPLWVGQAVPVGQAGPSSVPNAPAQPVGPATSRDAAERTPPSVDAASGVINGSCTAGALPAQIQTMLSARCVLCHGNPPRPTVPASLVSYEDLRRPSKSDPARTMAEAALARIRNPEMPMPPPPGERIGADQAAALATWIQMGMPLDGCGATDGGPPPRPDTGPDPFAAAPTCTSRTMYTGGEGPRMRPGDACISCHRADDGPDFAAAGTVYPTAHEPSRCNGVDGTGIAQGAAVTVTDAAGRSATASVNAAGNFFISGRAFTPPFRAKVVFMGRERVMIGAVPVADCNLCHSQSGTTTVAGGVNAPGRIVLP